MGQDSFFREDLSSALLRMQGMPFNLCYAHFCEDPFHIRFYDKNVNNKSGHPVDHPTLRIRLTGLNVRLANSHPGTLTLRHK